MEKFETYLRAGYPVLMVVTDEEQRCVDTLWTQAGDYAVYTWDLITGIKALATNEVKEMKDPVRALRVIESLPQSSVLFLLDFHVFMQNPEVNRTIKNLVPILKATDRHLVIVSPVMKIPPELTKLVTVIDFDLPTVEELKVIAKRLVDYVKENGNGVTYDESAVDFAKGLTAIEAENAISRSLVKTKTVDRKILEDEKLQVIKKTGLMEIYPPEPQDSLRGLENLKKYIGQRKAGFEDKDKPNPKGILLIGPPGTGKSLSAKVIAGILGFPLVKTSPENFKGGIVGESEQKTRNFWKTVKAIAPCVVWMDEIEKLFGGVASSARTDGGTGSAVFGMFLTEMQEMKEPIYFVATCNNVNELLAISQGAILRRFDDVFFLDLPNVEERSDIVSYMVKKYKTAGNFQSKIDETEHWTGAEIEKWVIGSMYEGVEDAFRNIKPVYDQNHDEIETAREWARDNARPANATISAKTFMKQQEKSFNRKVTL